MNPIISAFLVVLVLCLNLKADCPVGPYIVREQSFLDQFKETYVDCEQLDGLVVNGAPANSLAPLADIKSIKGDVIFKESFHFKSLAGMSSLKEIDGSLTVDDMDSVIDFAGFETLERIGGDFKVVTNDQLMDFNGFFMLKEIGGKLEITGNPSLNTFFKTTSLLFLGLTPESDLIVEDNPALVALEGLTSLKEVKGRISIQRNAVLENVDGLKGIFSVDSTIRISWNENLRNLDGLKNLETCNDTLLINRNALLESVDLQALKHARNGIVFSQNHALQRIDGANAMTHINGDLIIQGHLKLDTIRAFNGLIEVGGGIEFTNNTGGIADFSFLKSLKKVAESIDIMTSNQQIALTGFDSLTRVGNNFTLRTLAQSLSGLENLKYVGNLLHIRGDSLKNFASLANLDTVRELTISNNRNLTSLEGIGNIDATNLRQVTITFNAKLGHCAVKSLCDLLDLPGKLYLGNNATGCMDTTSLRRSCQEPNRIREAADFKRGRWNLVAVHGSGFEIQLDLTEASSLEARVYGLRGNLVADRAWKNLPSGRQRIMLPLVEKNRGVYWVEVKLGREKTLAKAVF